MDKIEVKAYVAASDGVSQKVGARTNRQELSFSRSAERQNNLKHGKTENASYGQFDKPKKLDLSSFMSEAEMQQLNTKLT